MVGNTNVPSVVKSSDKATPASKLGKAKPVAVHKNNHGNKNLANTGLKSNHILGAHIVEENEGWFYGWADKYDVWNNLSHISTNENKPSSSYTFTGNNSIFKLNKTKLNEKSKTKIVGEVPTSIKSDFYIGKCQK